MSQEGAEILQHNARPPYANVVGLLQKLGSEFGLYAIGFASLFIIWHVIAVFLVHSVLFPPPIPVLERAIALIEDGSLVVQVAASLKRILCGFTLGSMLGVAIGLVTGTFAGPRRFFEPYIETLRFIPAVAMITVAVIWFGIGETSKIFLITYSTIFIVVITTAAGVSGIPRNKIRAAQSLGCNRRQIFFFVTLPATVPLILTGMRVAMANSFATIVAAEMVAANHGLGVMLWDGRLFMQIDDIFVALLVLAALGFIVDRLFRWLSVSVVGKYSPVK